MFLIKAVGELVFDKPKRFFFFITSMNIDTFHLDDACKSVLWESAGLNQNMKGWAVKPNSNLSGSAGSDDNPSQFISTTDLSDFVHDNPTYFKYYHLLYLF